MNRVQLFGLAFHELREFPRLALGKGAAQESVLQAYSLAASVAYLLLGSLLGSRTEDEKLVGRIASGDAAALKDLYARTSDRAMALALRVLKDRSEAEDILQETFLEIWRRAGQFESSRGSAVSWVIMMTRSRAIDRLRARGASAKAVQGASEEPAVESARLPPALAEQHRDRARVLTALATLPAEQRRVIELAYFDGLTQTEIAANTSEPLGTVKTRIRLAMTKLADLLAERAEGTA